MIPAVGDGLCWPEFAKRRDRREQRTPQEAGAGAQL